jgi:hypothetical protein
MLLRRSEVVTGDAAQIFRISDRSPWRAHKGTELTNGVVNLTVLARGGHLAEFRYADDGLASVSNVMWVAPWVLEKPEGAPQYLSETAGITGHALCLDHFGERSDAETAIGLTLHGEAATREWKMIPPANLSQPARQWNVQLPAAQLDFERSIRLGDGESVAYFEETVTNRRAGEHVGDWVQHATFGPPFVNERDTTFIASAVRGLTSNTGYGPDSLILNGVEFSWPYAPLQPPRQGDVDLRRPFTAKGKGIVATVQLDPDRAVEYILAVNWRLRIGVGYCFRREDFPWMMVWEENCVRPNSPWNGSTQARGMEFGSTPFPADRKHTSRRSRLFDSPSWCVIPGNGAKTARYLMFLFKLPDALNAIEDVEVKGDSIEFRGQNPPLDFSISARGAESFLAGCGKTQ